MADQYRVGDIEGLRAISLERQELWLTAAYMIAPFYDIGRAKFTRVEEFVAEVRAHVMASRLGKDLPYRTLEEITLRTRPFETRAEIENYLLSQGSVEKAAASSIIVKPPAVTPPPTRTPIEADSYDALWNEAAPYLAPHVGMETQFIGNKRDRERYARQVRDLVLERRGGNEIPAFQLKAIRFGVVGGGIVPPDTIGRELKP